MNANILKFAYFLIISALINPLHGQAPKIMGAPRYETYITTSFRLIQMGFEKYAYIKNNAATNETDFIRNSDEANPGYYLMPPSGEESVADSTEKEFLGDLLMGLLSDYYYDSTILEYANNIHLPKLDRHEFYFDIYINEVHFLFSGWYGKLAHIIIFTNFDSKKSFVSQAEHFFNLPEMDIEKISYAQDLRGDELHDFFYSYNFADGSKLTGYPFLISISEDEISYKEVLLDLTIYPEEHPDEK